MSAPPATRHAGLSSLQQRRNDADWSGESHRRCQPCQREPRRRRCPVGCWDEHNARICLQWRSPDRSRDARRCQQRSARHQRPRRSRRNGAQRCRPTAGVPLAQRRDDRFEHAGTSGNRLGAGIGGRNFRWRSDCRLRHAERKAEGVPAHAADRSRGVPLRAGTASSTATCRPTASKSANWSNGPRRCSFRAPVALERSLVSG